MLKKIKLALYGQGEYMASLLGYFCRRSIQMIEPMLFTNLQALGQAVKAGAVDVLLTEEEMLEEVRGFQDMAVQIVLLSEGTALHEQQLFPIIFKYQSAEDVINELLSLIAENDHIRYTQRIISKKAVEIIGVYSPFGGAGVTKYALSMSEGLAKQYRTLYVNLELFHGLGYLLQGKKGQPEQRSRGMSEVIFYLKQKKEKLALKLDSLVFSKDGLDYIFAVEDFRDLYYLEEEETARFLEVLIQESVYQKLVFDIGYLGAGTLYLFRQLHRLYMPQPWLQVQIGKEEAFLQLLAREHCEEAVRQIIRVDMR
ncbi:MAG: hypothetical protein LUH14_09365 [Clostridiaceae bacterium]|nr:hypothetical protein [Clostridiaceae bacterium]